MIIVMRQGAAKKELNEVLKRIRDLGYKTHIIHGVERDVIGAIGDERGKARMERMRTALPLDVMFKKGEVPTPFPILIDADHAALQQSIAHTSAPRITYFKASHSRHVDSGAGPAEAPTLRRPHTT